MVKAPQVDSYIRMTLPIASKLFSGPHPLNPSTLFSSLPLSPPDLYLVSSEGFYLPTLRLLLTLHSPSFSSLLSPLPPSPFQTLHLPLPALTLSSLLSLLATGQSSSPDHFNPLQVVEAADLLGINLEDLEVATDVQEEAETEVSDDNLKNLEVDTYVQGKAETKVSGDKLSLEFEQNIISASPKKHSFVVSQLASSDDIQEKKLQAIGEKMIDFKTGIFNCDQCKYTTTNVKFGYRHVLTRHGDKKFQCKMCNYRSKSKGHLRGHMAAAHLGLRYDCDQCDFQSAHKKNVIGHKQYKHNDGKQPFTCDFCTYKAATELQMNQHTKYKHNENLQFNCTYCSFKSLTERGLKAHINNKHQ